MEIFGIDYHYWFLLEITIGIGLAIWGLRLLIGSHRDIYVKSDIVEFNIICGFSMSLAVIGVCLGTITEKPSEFVSDMIGLSTSFLVLSAILIVSSSWKIKKKIKKKYEDLPDQASSSLKQLEKEISSKKKKLLTR